MVRKKFYSNRKRKCEWKYFCIKNKKNSLLLTFSSLANLFFNNAKYGIILK